MNLDQLKEILKSASELTGQNEFYIIGSAAILAVIESPTDYLLSRSNEADLISVTGDPDMADTVSVMLGELSPYHDTHDVYAEGCTFETPTFAPRAWQERCIPVQYREIGVTAYYMEIHDLLLSKLGVGRVKDIEFCKALVKTGCLDNEVLFERLPVINATDDQRRIIEERIRTCAGSSLK